MSCPTCGHANPARAKFCLECGTPLAARCAQCGTELPPAAKFCLECGAALQGAMAVRGSEFGASSALRTPNPPTPNPLSSSSARKVVSILFADLAGSTGLQERLDAESTSAFMARYYAAMRAAIAAHGGTVVKLLGDGVMAAFGVPQVAEDDAPRAVRAGVAMQDAFRILTGEQAAVLGAVGLRVAINTGEVVVSGAHDDLIGDPVNVAARLQEQARNGDVVVGEATRRLVATRMTLEPLGSLALKGRAETVAAYRVVSLTPPAGTAAAPFVGRADEMARLGAVYDAAVAAPAARLAVLLGSPGLGKSRLIDELARRRGETATLLAAHCDAAGGATFAPLAAALCAHLSIEDAAAPEARRAAVEGALAGEDADRARIAGGVAALLAGSPASPEETFFVVRRFLAALARTRPVVLVIDDLHWAEPLLLDLVEHLVQWGGGVPLFVLVAARPELRELRSSLTIPGGVVSDVVTLGGLDAGAATRLAANVLGATDLPAVVAAKVLATSEGNPLFVGELVRMLVQEGALTRDGDSWTAGAGLAALEMPPTIHALLAARIERLRPDERTVLERAAVVGRHFSRSAVAALLSRHGGELDARLEALRRTELIERDTGWFLGEPVLRFHHVLIRDAAYRRLLKGTRAQLHARLADWIEERVGDAAEHDETIGWHLEQAHRHLRELGPLDANGKALGDRAARRLAAAGRRALARDDVPVAADLLGRAIDRLDQDDPSRAELALDWCEALLAGGDVVPAAGAIDELGRCAAGAKVGGYGVAGLGATDAQDRTPHPLTPNPLRLAAWHTCFAGQLSVLTAPENLQAAADAVAAAAQELTALADSAGEAKAHFVHALALARLGKVGNCEAALDRALAAARRADDRRRANTVLAIAPLAALWGPSPVTRASGRCLDVVRVLRITHGAPAVEAVALSCQAVLEALRGRTEAARRMIASSRKMVEDLGITQRLLEADVFGGLIDLLEGDAPAAQRNLRGAYEGLRDLGLGIDAARAAALLARALLAQGQVAEAEALSHESEALAGDDLKAAIAWRGVRAEALARRGEHAAAVELAQAAVGIASATDALLDHADARLALAVALRAAGRSAEADTERRRAIELWEAKGATLLAERVRRADAPHVRATSSPEAPSAPAPSTQRRVRANTATRNAERLHAAIAARDADALMATLSEHLEVIYHPTGSTYAAPGLVETWRALFAAREMLCRHTPLASGGERLALVRQSISYAGIELEGLAAVGGAEADVLLLLEVDERGRACWSEVFAADRLGDAIARLYERHAELLPDGPERERAAAAARSAATVFGPIDVLRWTSALDPRFELHDRRTLGLGLLDRDTYLHSIGAILALSESVSMRVDDVLALSSEALVLRVTTSGTQRDGGGAFERPFLGLFVLGADGLFVRFEQIDADHEAEALARFDALVSSPMPAPAVRRRVRANAATENLERFGAAIAARDVDALAREVCEGLEVVHHQTGATYGRKELLTTWRSLFRAKHMIRRQEPLASLGGSLALAHHSISLEGFAEAHLTSVGIVEIDEVVLFEVDEQGRDRRFDIFATERLGNAIVRLYERYAELLPDGLAREHAAATARTLGSVLQPADLDAWCDSVADEFELVDHRVLGVGALRGGEAMRANFRAMFELEQRFHIRIDDVLALRSDAILFLGGNSGAIRASGGTYERRFLQLWSMRSDGRFDRIEYFDADRGAEALARFDALTSRRPEGPGDRALTPRRRRRFRPNAASAIAARTEAAVAARDLNAVDALLGESMESVDHANGITHGREGHLDSSRRMMHLPGLVFRLEPLATLGERLCLIRRRVSASGTAGGNFDVAECEMEHVGTLELDDVGRCRAFETFAADRLGDAVARLYQRHADLLPEGPARRRAAAMAVRIDRTDLNDIAGALDPAIEMIDHRLVGPGTIRGVEAVLAAMRALRDAAEDPKWRTDEILALSDEAILRTVTSFGRLRDGGGHFERHICALHRYGSDGRLTHWEVFDADRAPEALARFDELVPSEERTPAPPFANAASRSIEREMRCWEARDWDALQTLVSPAIRFHDRRRLLRVEVGIEEFVAQQRMLFEQPGSRWTEPLIATRGERLSLHRVVFEAEVAGGGGPLAIEDHLVLVEVDAEGRWVALVLFDLDDLDAAYAELDARWAAGDPLIHVVELDVNGQAARLDLYDPHHSDAALARFAEIEAKTVPTSRAAVKPNAATAVLDSWQVLDTGAEADWDALRASCAPGMIFEDRQGFARLCGDREMMIASLRERVASGGRAERRLIGTAGERIAITRMLWTGGPADGRFEIEYLSVLELDETGLAVAIILFSADDARAAQREAWARWVAIDPAAADVTAALGEFIDGWNAKDLERLRAAFAEDFVFEDHRRTGIGRSAGREAYLRSVTVLWELAPESRFEAGWFWLALAPHAGVYTGRRAGTLPSGGEFESDFLAVAVVEGGRTRCVEIFEIDAVDAALARLEELCAARE